jgi:hypothetical protein
MFTKFLSRKLIVSVIAFITVTVLPNLPTATRAKYQVWISAAYVIAQGFADAFGSGTAPSQGTGPAAP